MIFHCEIQYIFLIFAANIVEGSNNYTNEIWPYQQPEEDFGGSSANSDFNATTAFWTDAKIREALENDYDFLDYNISDFNETTAGSRKRRSTDSDDPVPSITIEDLQQMGFPTNHVQLLAGEHSEVSVADLTRVPWKYYGKLFFNKGSGVGICTAAYVDERVLLTAAHCVKNSQWYSNFLFRHRYNVGQNSDRKVQILKAFAPNGYPENIRYDYAFLTTVGTSDGGYLKRKFNQEISNLIISAGYPRNYHDNGKLVFTKGRIGTKSVGLVNVPSNSMNQGSSGGPWLNQLPDGFYAVGLNSFAITNKPEMGVFSPVLDEKTQSLFNMAIQSLPPLSDGDFASDNGGNRQPVQASRGLVPMAPPTVKNKPVPNQNNHNHRPQHGCNQDACKARCNNNYQWNCNNGHENCQCVSPYANNLGGNCNLQDCVRRCDGSYGWNCNNGRETCTCHG